MRGSNWVWLAGLQMCVGPVLLLLLLLLREGRLVCVVVTGCGLRDYVRGSSVVVAVEREDFCVWWSSVVVAVGKGSRDFLTGFQARMFNLHNTKVCTKKCNQYIFVVYLLYK